MTAASGSKRSGSANRDELGRSQAAGKSQDLPQAHGADLEVAAAAIFGGRLAPDGSLAAKNFVDWYRGSRAVDVKGRPLVLFHGTVVQGTTFDTPPGELPSRAFTEFDLDWSGSVSQSSDAREGFWFSSSRDRALTAAVEAKRASGGGSAYVYEVFLALRNPFVVASIAGLEPVQVARLARKARAHGHDGLIFEKGEFDEGADYLAFSPKAIKSANANSGAFVLDSSDVSDGNAEHLARQRSLAAALLLCKPLPRGLAP